MHPFLFDPKNATHLNISLLIEIAIICNILIDKFCPLPFHLDSLVMVQEGCLYRFQLIQQYRKRRRTRNPTAQLVDLGNKIDSSLSFSFIKRFYHFLLSFSLCWNEDRRRKREHNSRRIILISHAASQLHDSAGNEAGDVKNKSKTNDGPRTRIYMYFLWVYIFGYMECSFFLGLAKIF